VKWAANFKRKEGGTGLKAGDVIFVAGEPTPDITVQLITDYGVPKKRAANAPWRLRQVPAIQGALVAMDPHTGRILAMTGGYSFVSSKFNRAIQAKRQPGSSFKPFVYAAAMETPDPATGLYKWTPSYRVLDTPYVSCQTIAGEETCYKPQNYSEQFYGLTPLRIGVEKSRNAMTVRLASEIGFDKVSAIGERLGIYDELPPYESMALGAGDTTLMRMAVAYAETVNGGKQVHPVMFDRIQNRYGKTVYRTDQRACQGCATEWKGGLVPPVLADDRQQVLDPITAYQVVSILEGAVQRGTGTTIRSVGKPIAAKTGTTNDQFDAWTMGFSPDLVAGVWVGFDTPRDMGTGESGGRVAAPIFRDFMLAALKDRPAVTFRVPNGVEHVEVDADTGCQPGPDTRLIITEAFRPGSAPTDRCEAPIGADGYRVDFSKVAAGDETASATRDGQVTSQPVDPTQPVDPNNPQQPVEPPKDEDLTFDDGTF
jgi:penicillin-binding protein 1A